MKLSLLLKALYGTKQKADEEITLITDDSRACVPGTLFVCHSGAEQFLPEAKANGAVAVVASKQLDGTCFVAADTRSAYAVLCRAFFGFADTRLHLVAVTGTNGKTTVAFMLAHILALCGKQAGLLSTVTNTQALGCTMTTPDCFALHRALRKMADEGKTFCVLEASSQGLAEHRLDGLHFSVGVFTNLTRDHLDVHGTFEQYKAAKRALFPMCETAVLNFDDPAWRDMASACPGRVLTYSVQSNEADFSAKDVRLQESAIDYALVSDFLIHRVHLPLQGEFNIENSMAAVIAAMQLGISVQESAAALSSFSPVPGRMEHLSLDLPFRVFLDYAHTPDSLQRALRSLRRFCKGRLTVVFGCGGDRDSGKRPEMGRVAVSFADKVVLTSDNPRSEDANAIIDDILAGTADSKTPVFLQPDRAAAIRFALKTAKSGDVILLAGKGHETTQTINEEVLAFDEREIVKNQVKGMF